MKRVSVFDLSNNDLLFMATQIQDGSLSGTVDQQEITGMNGIVIARLDRSKGASVSWGSIKLSCSLYSMITMAAANNNVIDYFKILEETC